MAQSRCFVHFGQRDKNHTFQPEGHAHPASLLPADAENSATCPASSSGQNRIASADRGPIRDSPCWKKSTRASRAARNRSSEVIARWVFCASRETNVRKRSGQASNSSSGRNVGKTRGENRFCCQQLMVFRVVERPVGRAQRFNV